MFMIPFVWGISVLLGITLTAIDADASNSVSGIENEESCGHADETALLECYRLYLANFGISMHDGNPLPEAKNFHDNYKNNAETAAGYCYPFWDLLRCSSVLPEACASLAGFTRIAKNHYDASVYAAIFAQSHVECGAGYETFEKEFQCIKLANPEIGDHEHCNATHAMDFLNCKEVTQLLRCVYESGTHACSNGGDNAGGKNEALGKLYCMVTASTVKILDPHTSECKPEKMCDEIAESAPVAVAIEEITDAIFNAKNAAITTEAPQNTAESSSSSRAHKNANVKNERANMAMKGQVKSEKETPNSSTNEAVTPILFITLFAVLIF